MAGLLSDLKARARILHRHVVERRAAAIASVQQLAELRTLDPQMLAQLVKRRHCLAVVAKEIGFDTWPHAAAVLSGKDSSDFGTLLYPRGAEVHWNIWCASYEEARAIREQRDGYLLAYRRHFFVADRHFITTIGLDPEAADWELIGRDWVKPRHADARERLYAELIRRRAPRVIAA